MSFGIGAQEESISGNTVTFRLYEETALWDIHYWTQEEVDAHIPHLQHKVGTIWWQQYNKKYHLDSSNSLVLRLQFYSNGHNIGIKWTNDLTKEWHYLAGGNMFPSTIMNAVIYIDKNHPIASKILGSDAEFMTVYGGTGNYYPSWIYEFTAHNGVVCKSKKW